MAQHLYPHSQRPWHVESPLCHCEPAYRIRWTSDIHPATTVEHKDVHKLQPARS